jgi:hypothetical protein
MNNIINIGEFGKIDLSSLPKLEISKNIIEIKTCPAYHNCKKYRIQSLFLNRMIQLKGILNARLIIDLVLTKTEKQRKNHEKIKKTAIDLILKFEKDTIRKIYDKNIEASK